MVELLSRHGDERPGRPCPREGVKRPGDAPSAGRVAAPDQLPDDRLGHGHSAASVTAAPKAMVGAVVRALALVGLFVGPAAAQTLVKPGDTGQIEYPVEHLTDSAGPLEGLEISVTAPAHFVVKGTSIKGPFTFAPGETRTFVIDYEIAADAPEGAFNVGLVLAATTEGIDPDLNTPDTVVSFGIEAVTSSVDGLG